VFMSRVLTATDAVYNVVSNSNTTMQPNCDDDASFDEVVRDFPPFHKTRDYEKFGKYMETHRWSVRVDAMSRLCEPFTDAFIQHIKKHYWNSDVVRGMVQNMQNYMFGVDLTCSIAVYACCLFIGIAQHKDWQKIDDDTRPRMMYMCVNVAVSMLEDEDCTSPDTFAEEFGLKGLGEKEYKQLHASLQRTVLKLLDYSCHRTSEQLQQFVCSVMEDTEDRGKLLAHLQQHLSSFGELSDGLFEVTVVTQTRQLKLDFAEVCPPARFEEIDKRCEEICKGTCYAKYVPSRKRNLASQRAVLQKRGCSCDQCSPW